MKVKDGRHRQDGRHRPLAREPRDRPSKLAARLAGVQRTPRAIGTLQPSAMMPSGPDPERGPSPEGLLARRAEGPMGFYPDRLRQNRPAFKKLGNWRSVHS